MYAKKIDTGKSGIRSNTKKPAPLIRAVLKIKCQKIILALLERIEPGEIVELEVHLYKIENQHNFPIEIRHFKKLVPIPSRIVEKIEKHLNFGGSFKELNPLNLRLFL